MKLKKLRKPTKIVPNSKYPYLYHLKWSDGVLSEDFYNKTRANDILLNYSAYKDYMERRASTIEKYASQGLLEGNTEENNENRYTGT